MAKVTLPDQVLIPVTLSRAPVLFTPGPFNVNNSPLTLTCVCSVARPMTTTPAAAEPPRASGSWMFRIPWWTVVIPE